MNDSFEQPDDDQPEGFFPSLDDPELRQLESELADRLVAGSAHLDRGRILHEAGWQAALEAKQQEQVAASSLLAVSAYKFSDSNRADLIQWSSAVATVAAVGIAVALFTQNRTDDLQVEPMITDAEVFPLITPLDQSTVAEDQALLTTDSDLVKDVDASPQVPSRNRFLGMNQGGRPLYRAGAGGFSQIEIEALLSDRPTPLLRNSSDSSVPTSNRPQGPLRDLDPAVPEPTVFNLMREWAIYGPAAD